MTLIHFFFFSRLVPCEQLCWPFVCFHPSSLKQKMRVSAKGPDASTGASPVFQARCVSAGTVDSQMERIASVCHARIFFYIFHLSFYGSR
jgi:hypothetical protein